MITYLVIGLVSTAVLLACVATGPAEGHSRDKAAARRRRFVEHHPIHVGSHDILAMMLEGGIAPDQAELVVAKAADQGIKPFTMWLWTQQFDVWSLSVAVAADLTHHELLTHLSEGTVPDLERLQLFASANGLETVARPSRTRGRRLLVGFAGAARATVPPIFEPGTWPRTGRADAA